MRLFVLSMFCLLGTAAGLAGAAPPNFANVPTLKGRLELKKLERERAKLVRELERTKAAIRELDEQFQEAKEARARARAVEQGYRDNPLKNAPRLEWKSIIPEKRPAPGK